MRERNPPRNSHLETHRTDAAEGDPVRFALAYSSTDFANEPLTLVWIRWFLVLRCALPTFAK